MKGFVSISGFIFLIACSQQASDTSSEKLTSEDSNYGARLIKIGFLGFADTTKIDSLSSALIRRFDIYDDDINKTTHIDAEELAEFSFDFFLPRLKQILKLRGFDLIVRTSDDYQDLWNYCLHPVEGLCQAHADSFCHCHSHHLAVLRKTLLQATVLFRSHRCLRNPDKSGDPFCVRTFYGILADTEGGSSESSG